MGGSTELNSEGEPMETDTLQTWGIKNMPKSLIEAIGSAARREDLTVAQWLERCVRAWLENGSPTELTPVKPTQDDLHRLAELARMFTPDGRDSEAMKAGRRIVRERLQAFQPPPLPLLEAPEA
jgi:hypothetical protein